MSREVSFSTESLQNRTPSFITHDCSDEIAFIDLSLDGSLVLTSALDDTANCYLVTNGSKEFVHADKPYGINNLKFTSQNDLIYSNRKGNVGIIKKVSIHNNSVLWLANNCHSAPISSLDSGICSNLVTVSNDQVMKLWDLKCDKVTDSMNFPGMRNPKVRFDPASLVICLNHTNESRKSIFKFIDKRKLNEVLTTSEFHNGTVTDFEFSDDGTHILVSTESNTLVLLDSLDGKEIREFHDFKNDLGRSIGSMTENSKFIAIGCESANQVKIFETHTGKPVTELVAHPRTPRRVIWSKHYGVLFSACHNLIYWTIE
jgi:hypothetical protein